MNPAEYFMTPFETAIFARDPRPFPGWKAVEI